jgi:hypothetical protein
MRSIHKSDVCLRQYGVTSHKLLPCMLKRKLAINNGRLLPISHTNSNHNKNSFNSTLQKMLSEIEEKNLNKYATGVVDCLNLVVSEYARLYANKDEANEVIAHGRYLQCKYQGFYDRKPKYKLLKQAVLKYADMKFEEEHNNV